MYNFLNGGIRVLYSCEFFFLSLLIDAMWNCEDTLKVDKNEEGDDDDYRGKRDQEYCLKILEILKYIRTCNF